MYVLFVVSSFIYIRIFYLLLLLLLLLFDVYEYVASHHTEEIKNTPTPKSPSLQDSWAIPPLSPHFHSSSSYSSSSSYTPSSASPSSHPFISSSSFHPLSHSPRSPQFFPQTPRTPTIPKTPQFPVFPPLVYKKNKRKEE